MRLMLANFAKMIGDTGGAAKVFAAFANEMTRRGHEVSMVYSDDREGEFFYKVVDQVRTFNLRHYQGSDIRFPWQLKVKREILKGIDTRVGRKVNDDFNQRYLLPNLKAILAEVKPDVIVTFHPTASKSLICDLNVDVPVITMSHGDPEDYFHTYPIEELTAIEHSTVNQVLLPSFEQPIRKRYPSARVVTIGNVVPQYEETADLLADKPVHKIIFLARLVKNHKQPHLLVEAFCKIASQFPDWIVELWGADDKLSYKKSMQRTINRAGLQERARFMGTTHDVAEILKQGDIFAFPSAYEGWGMSLTEAMRMGLPAVGFKSCVAVNELIQDGKTGILTNDGAEAYAAGLASLMSNRELRVAMGQAGREAMTPYSAENIWNQWEALLDDVIKAV
jgi:glycosyltransferase involved in cell wall biosynthesis